MIRDAYMYIFAFCIALDSIYWYHWQPEEHHGHHNDLSFEVLDWNVDQGSWLQFHQDL